MTAIKQGSNSVHYTGTETISRRTFIGPRYEVPLFLCKRLSVPVERSDTVEQEVLRNGRRELLQEMKHYGLLPNWKAGIAVNLCPDWKTSGKRPTNLSLPRPCCQKSLRNGHKEWTLPPNRYRLGGNISDSASKSTGTKGPYQCFTGDRFPTVVPGVSGGTPGLQPGEELYYEQIPREMDKLAQPRRYFVGKIRPGDKATERPCSRLALSTATLCWRNPADPGPDRYFKGIFDIALPKLVATTTADPPTTVRHSYCAEPFRRPPPGRYDLTVCRGLVPLNVAPPRQRRLRRRLEMTLNASWKPFRQVATLRMHTVDIPKRRRKRGRNMKPSAAPLPASRIRIFSPSALSNPRYLASTSTVVHAGSPPNLHQQKALILIKTTARQPISLLTKKNQRRRFNWPLWTVPGPNCLSCPGVTKRWLRWHDFCRCRHQRK
ncbi:uncharacterized protein LOC120423580 isoform X3 [Culex pipiens pallens]|uniref:uncharacterized protein LOC120423580 isoform X3 n=1 Tax=Culex pipiens pallens TaxID=42434 RepID=UPI0022AAFA14|nr:uncharacterized protein LOC120423580 isoform X3 [Culex pipiens pallens]